MRATRRELTSAEKGEAVTVPRVDRGAKHSLTEPAGPEIPDDFRARWKARFEYRATVLDDDAGIAGWTTSGLEARFRAFVRYWRFVGPGELWLDIGCGAGTYTRFLHAQGLRVVGIDYSFPTLRKARARSPADMWWLAADGTRLPIRTGVVDGVLCFGVLQAIPATESALRAIADALKPSGVVWIDFLNARFIPTRWQIRRWRKTGKPAHLRYETARVVVQALHECGYAVIAIHPIPILPSALRALQPLVSNRVSLWLLHRARPLAELISHSILIEARRRDTDARNA